jgi:hypothetical protein
MFSFYMGMSYLVGNYCAWDLLEIVTPAPFLRGSRQSGIHHQQHCNSQLGTEGKGVLGRAKRAILSLVCSIHGDEKV